jgi:hypothetical protein
MDFIQALIPCMLQEHGIDTKHYFSD